MNTNDNISGQGTANQGTTGATEQMPHARETRLGPRTSPIVWGTLILVFCGYIAQRVFGTGTLDTAWWVTATVIGLGTLLLIVGLAVLLRSGRDRRADPPSQ